MIMWFLRLPMSVRLPVAAAAMILAVAVGTTQIAIQSLSRQVERQMDRLGQVYLDGLSAAVQPAARASDTAAVGRALDEALKFHVGVLDRRLVWLDDQGRAAVWADRPGLPPRDLPDGVGQGEQGMWFDVADGSTWVWRRLVDTADPSARLGTVVANLDVAEFIRERERLGWSLAGVDLLVSAICAWLGFVVMRRLQRPVALLTRHLQRSGEEGPVPVPEGDLPRSDPETAALLKAYNRMAWSAREREAMLARLAEQEREAVLGRLVATLAHEVRNPLGGVLTAIHTLRRFGDKPEVREEALDFMERGVVALREVVDATLKTHRLPDPPRAFGQQDLLDVVRLADADARRRQIEITLDADLPGDVPVASGEVRQVLLNLLLNAVHASPPGKRVLLRAGLVDRQLKLEVIDEGTGLPPSVAQDLEAGMAPHGQIGLGVAVVVRLVERLQGRVSVDAHSGRGTRITLHLPLQSSNDQA